MYGWMVMIINAERTQSYSLCTIKNNVQDIIVVTSFGEDRLSEHIGNRGRCIYNPFFEVTGILASTWLDLKKLSGILVDIKLSCRFIPNGESKSHSGISR